MTSAELLQRLACPELAAETLRAGADARHLADFEREPDDVLPRGLQPVEPAAYILTVAESLYGHGPAGNC